MSKKFEELKKKCDQIKFDPQVQPRVGLTFILRPDVSIIDRNASIRKTMETKKQQYCITKDFEIIIRKIIAKQFCNCDRYVYQITGKDDGVFLDPEFFSVTLNVFYAGGEIEAGRFIKELKRLDKCNSDWKALSSMTHAIIVEDPNNNTDRAVLPEDGIKPPVGVESFDNGLSWVCWVNHNLKNTTGLKFVDPDESIKAQVADSLFNNEIFNSNKESGGLFKKLFGFIEKVIPGTNVTVSSNNIRRKETVTLGESPKL